MFKHNFTRSLVVTGGGTGGHYFPAVAIAEGAKTRWSERPIVFVGSKRGIESRLLAKSDWPYLLLDVEGFMGRSPHKIFRAGWKLALAFYQIRTIWEQNRPWVVVGTGGYGSAPALLAARSLGIPFFIHESNAKPGLLVRHLASSAAGVWCGMDIVQTYLSSAKCIFTGTPVRSSFLRSFSAIQLNNLQSEFRLLVLGGSGGASTLNEAVLAMVPTLMSRFPNLYILHQVGANEFQRLTSFATNSRHRIVPFLSNMDVEMEAANLIITRAGASTCAELMVCGRPSIVVPMPNSAGNHQVMNAQAMVADKRSLIVYQTDNLSRDLLDQVSTLIAKPQLLFEMTTATANTSITRCLDDLQAKLIQ